MVRFLHTADWHVGMPARFLREEAAARFAQARLDAVRALGRAARERDCAFILACGDTFDSNLVSRRTVHQLTQALAEVPVPVYLLPGNHDPLDPATIYRRAEFRDTLPPHVHVLAEPAVVPLGPGAELAAAPWRSRRPTEALAAAACHDLAPCPPGAVRILAGHGAVDVLRPDEGVDLSLVHLRDLEQGIAAGVVHYVALGDRHSTTRVGGTGRVWYPGSPEVTAFDEQDSGGALVVEVDGAACSVRPLRIGRWRLLHHRCDVTGAAGVEALGDWLQQLADKGETVVRLEAAGTVDMQEHARLLTLLERFEDILAGLELADDGRALAVLPTTGDFEAFGLGGFAAAAIAELRQRAAGADAGAQAAQDALRLAFRLAGRASP